MVDPIRQLGADELPPPDASFGPFAGVQISLTSLVEWQPILVVLFRYSRIRPRVLCARRKGELEWTKDGLDWVGSDLLAVTLPDEADQLWLAWTEEPGHAEVLRALPIASLEGGVSMYALRGSPIRYAGDLDLEVGGEHGFLPPDLIDDDPDDGDVLEELEPELPQPPEDEVLAARGLGPRWRKVVGGEVKDTEAEREFWLVFDAFSSTLQGDVSTAWRTVLLQEMAESLGVPKAVTELTVAQVSGIETLLLERVRARAQQFWDTRSEAHEARAIAYVLFEEGVKAPGIQQIDQLHLISEMMLFFFGQESSSSKFGLYEELEGTESNPRFRVGDTLRLAIQRFSGGMLRMPGQEPGNGRNNVRPDTGYFLFFGELAVLLSDPDVFGVVTERAKWRALLRAWLSATEVFLDAFSMRGDPGVTTFRSYDQVNRMVPGRAWDKEWELDYSFRKYADLERKGLVECWNRLVFLALRDDVWPSIP